MPDKVDLAFAFGLPPERAIEYFRQKGYAITWNWFELWEAAQARAFTVARAMRQDILEEIRSELDRALAEGMTLREFQDNLTPRLQALGWWGKQVIVDSQGEAEKVELGSPRRLATIFRTNLQNAYMAGRHRYLEEIGDTHPYWQYVAVMDLRTRASHAALHGKVWRRDDPIWRTHYPPNGFNCRCRVRPISQRMLERRGLKVENSDGMLVEREVRVGTDKRTGEVITAPVTGVRVTGRDGRERIVWTDAGWSYNPARAAWPT